MDIRVGIDLGSTNTKIAYVDESGQAIGINNSEGNCYTPSVLCFEDDNVIVGEVAKELAFILPENIITGIDKYISKPTETICINAHTLTSEEIIALIIKKVIFDASTLLDSRITGITFSIPNYYGTMEINTIKNAAIIAGINDIDFLSESAATFLAYTNEHDTHDYTALIFNLGGSSFTVSVAKKCGDEISVIAIDGDHHLGGIEWDNILVQYLKDEFMSETGYEDEFDEYALQDIALKSEKLKMRLSQALEASVCINAANDRARITITRELFENLTQHLLDRVINITDSLIENVKSQGYNIDTILLVGGSTRMPMISKTLYLKYGIEPKFFDPDLVLAKGAAIYASMNKYSKKDNNASDKYVLKVISNSKSIKQEITLNDWQLYYSGESEASVCKEFCIIDYGVGEVNLELYECKEENRDGGNHNIATVSFNSPKRSIPTIVQVKIKMDSNGVLGLYCEDYNNKKQLLKVEFRTKSYLKYNKAEIVY